MTDAGDEVVEQERQRQFEREKVCYEQNSQQFRALNQIMWQIPIIAITLTGGLWYAVSTHQAIAVFRFPALLLGTTLDLALMIVLTRVRYIMGMHLDKLRQFYPPSFVEAAGTESGTRWFHKRKVVLYAFNSALAIASISCFVGSIYFAVVDWQLCGFLHINTAFCRV